MFFIDRRVYLLSNLRLHDMENRQFKGDACQWACPCRIPMDNGFRIKLRAIGIRGPDDDNEVLLVMFVNNLLDAFLTFQVNAARGGSDKTLGLDQQWFGAGAFYARSNRLPLNPIPFPEHDNLFPF
jgi:hypothetical protein